MREIFVSITCICWLPPCLSQQQSTFIRDCLDCFSTGRSWGENIPTTCSANSYRSFQKYFDLIRFGDSNPLTTIWRFLPNLLKMAIFGTCCYCYFYLCGTFPPSDCQQASYILRAASTAACPRSVGNGWTVVTLQIVLNTTPLFGRQVI